MKCIVTGGTGILGANIVRNLSEDGHHVRVLARNPDALPELFRLANVEAIQGDMLQFDRYDEWLTGIECVVHNVLIWGETAHEMFARDTQAAVLLLDRAIAAGVQEFLYTSSTAAFGEYVPDMTEDKLSNPIDWYGATKSAAEKFIIAASREEEIRTNVVRPGYMFGMGPVPGAKPTGALLIDYVRKAVAGEPIEVPGNKGTQFIHQEDVAEVYRRILRLPESGSGQVYHAVSWDETPFAKIAGYVVSRTGNKSKILTKPDDETQRRVFDLTKLRDRLGLSFTAWPKLERFVDELLDGGVV